ncbi:hypothetical protein FJQ54_13070 [Sandaracinobacter neustonicus]|uniref:Zona occludens toxin N-terminal domain-containing protein n=1 Tax=Sandaracinobacter neustonicus TaxID=1715348 RepID=A0A501XFS4_9SPHN|nr:zonular occludens toxin domain-containing protein [Sandaracinobacter neustonicus]TPE59422.1 hypothetical protein FJQ54_13070 [Sandaracinobacter neustonicus]
MIVTLYVGLQGSGKSLELVRSVILPALAQGRRVVTNLPMNIEAVKSHFGEQQVGELVQVLDEQLCDDASYPTSARPGTIIRGGDVVVIDEAHNIYPPSTRPKSGENWPARFDFIAMARHYTDEQGRTCNIALATQSAASLAKFVRDRIGETFVCRNLGSLSLGKRYRVTNFPGCLINRSNRGPSRVVKHDPSIFPLYQSSSAANFTVGRLDSRGLIFRGSFLFSILAALGSIIGGFFWAKTYFFPACDPPEVVYIENRKSKAFKNGKEIQVITTRDNAGRYIFTARRCSWSVQPYAGGGLVKHRHKSSSS